MHEPSKTRPPEWAVLFARGALRLGMRVPEIEQHLVSRGLSPEEANRIVMELVEGDVQQRMAPLAEAERAERGKPIRLALSVAIAGACLLLAYWFGGAPSVGRALIWVVPELICIWLPEVTDTADSDWGVRCLVSGWFLLFLYFGYRIFLWFMV